MVARVFLVVFRWLLGCSGWLRSWQKVSNMFGVVARALLRLCQ